MADRNLGQIDLLTEQLESGTPFRTYDTVRIFGREDIFIKVQNRQVIVTRIDVRKRAKSRITRQRALPIIPMFCDHAARSSDHRDIDRELPELVLVGNVPAIS